MPIPVTLSCCRRTATVPDHFEGRTLEAKCPKCGGTYKVTVPYLLPDEPEPAGPTLTGRAWALFGCVAKAVVKGGLNYLTPGVPTGDWVADGWDAWHKREADEDAKKAEVAELQLADPDEVRRQAEAVVAAVAAGLPAEARQRLADYLTQIPQALRRSMVADDPDEADGTGESAPAPVRTLRRPEDLAALLPARMPRFRPGDRPPGIGDWQLVELLGSGGFGEVWKATNPNLASVRPVALKFCLDPAAAVGLRNEAAMLDQVLRNGRRHPGIVPLLHTYLSADPPCLEYELVEGGDLAGVVRELHDSPEGPGPRLVAKVTELMEQLFGAVAFAHRLDPPVVHHDLKPANVLARRGRGGRSRCGCPTSASGREPRRGPWRQSAERPAAVVP